MGNQWLSGAFSKFTSSVLRKSNEEKVDNISDDSYPNSTSILKSDFNFFLLKHYICFSFRKGVKDLFNNKIKGILPPKIK